MLEFDYHGTTLQMEHSLISISKWESVFKKPYLVEQTLSAPEKLMYYDFMIVNGEVPDWKLLDQGHIELIERYINDDSTATRINNQNGDNPRNQIITSELLYAYMALAGVDISAENWHVNRLLILLSVIGELQQEKKPMSQADIYEQNRKLNEERRKKYASKG